jgi:hypothetical protein
MVQLFEEFPFAFYLKVIKPSCSYGIKVKYTN